MSNEALKEILYKRIHAEVENLITFEDEDDRILGRIETLAEIIRLIGKDK